MQAAELRSWLHDLKLENTSEHGNVKDIDPRPGLASSWPELTEALMHAIKLQRAESARLSAGSMNSRRCKTGIRDPAVCRARASSEWLPELMVTTP